MYRNIGNLENSKIDRQSSINQFKELETYCNKLYTEISLKENQIVTIENYIEKYLPVKVLD